MLVPALYVAAEAARRAAGAYDVHIMAEEGELDGEHRRWMEARNIQAIAGLDFSDLRRITLANTRLTSATLIRLVMPEILAGRYDRVLYLDADTEIAGDIGGMFKLDLNGAVLAAVPASRVPKLEPPGAYRQRVAHFRALGMSEPYRFFNSGVMLIDIARWLKQGIGMRALEFIRDNPSICWLPDEHSLNAVLDGRICELSPIWNFRTTSMTLLRGRDDVVPVIRHYDGPQKPWKRFARGRRLFSLEGAYRRYRRFVAATPWRDWLRQQWSPQDLLDNLRYEVRALFAHASGRKVRGVRTRQRHRKLRKIYLRYLRETTFDDVRQGIAVFRNGRLMLDPDRGAADS
jgi:lipopolysaccharide biosynthesis glycosyltransferase